MKSHSEESYTSSSVVGKEPVTLYYVDTFLFCVIMMIFYLIHVVLYFAFAPVEAKSIS